MLRKKTIYELFPSCNLLDLIDSHKYFSAQRLSFERMESSFDIVIIFYVVEGRKFFVDVKNIAFLDFPFLDQMLNDSLENVAFSNTPLSYKHFYKRTSEIFFYSGSIKSPVDDLFL